MKSHSAFFTVSAVLAWASSVVASPLQPRDGAITIEAETGVLSGTDIETSIAGYIGTGYVAGFDQPTDSVTVTVNASSTALYDVTIRYTSPNGDKKAYLVLNNGPQDEISLAGTSGWVDLKADQVLLNQGSNTVAIVSNWGYYGIDSLTFTPTPPRSPHQIGADPVNPNANADARALFNYLKSIYGTNTLSGQQDTQWLDYVTQQTGKTSAVLGVDFMDYSPSRVEYGATSNTTEQAIAFHQRGGIVTFVWHWNAPTGLYNTAEQPWWSGFYTAASDFNIATAMADTTNANYTLILRDIDAIAVQLRRLRDAGVPVLFRVLHEADGGWFWWGAHGAEPCKQLWALVYDRITNHHGLSNILWVWNSLSPEWYPGDTTVDIVSTDVYATGNGPMAPQYNSLIALGSDTKMVAVAEVGSVPRDDLMVAYEAQWLWFLCWGDGLINSATYNPPDVLNNIYNSQEVLTLDEIQGWRG